MTEPPDRPTGSSAPILQLQGVNVFYGRSHALQGVDLSLHSGVLSVVGRNGMGKTTMCKAIMGLVRISSGSIRFMGEEIVGARRQKSRGWGSAMCHRGVACGDR